MRKRASALLCAIARMPVGWSLAFGTETDEHGEEFLTSVLFDENGDGNVGVSALDAKTLERLTCGMLRRWLKQRKPPEMR
jgi:hypothetical protein